MAARNAIMPGARTPFVDKEGRVNPTWYRFLVDLHERTGGGATDKVATVETTATTAVTSAAAAQTTADDAYTLAESGVASGGVTAEEIQEIKFLRDFGDGR